MSLLLALPLSAALGQRLTILIDPARGGTEDGARIDEHTTEKQVTLDVAARLRSLLNARDFDVLLTRDADVQVSNEARAAAANQNKPIACILLHATAAGKGLHLFTTSLQQAAPQGYAVPWDEAQALFVQRSQRLANELATAFGRAKIPVSSGQTWIRPLDNMQCPAVAVEIAPSGDGDTAADRSYQTRIADTIAGAMLFWRGHTDMVQSIVAPPPPEPKPAPSTEPAPAKPGTAATASAPPRAAVPARLPGSATPAGTPQDARPKPAPAVQAAPSAAPPRPAVSKPKPAPQVAPTLPTGGNLPE